MRAGARGLLRLGGMAALLAVFVSAARAQNQTGTLSPIVVGGGVPYTITLDAFDFGGASQLPTLHSYALGVYNGQWVLVAGRTNGLHDFTNDGFQNFPPAFQNTFIWVIDPVAKIVSSRSLQDPTSGLSVAQVDALSSTSAEFTQIGDTLYIAGGYVYDRVADNFTTYDTLTALDLAGVVDWVVNSNGTLISHLRQTSDPLLRVTGGQMNVIGGRTFLTFGQDFEGPYNTGANGNYTMQVRAFDIVDNGVTLSIVNPSSSAPDDDYRRRDLNVMPMMQSDGMGGFNEGLIAFSGVFTLAGGAWTVPVEINSSGTPSMADPTAPATFKQGMNNYEAAHISLYSASRDETHTILMGGISLEFYNTTTGQIAYDSFMPFIDSMSSIVRTASGVYTQYYLGEFPSIPNPSNGNTRFLFGANARFIPAAGIATSDNGMLNLDALTAPTVIGYIFGGIIAQIPNFGGTGASNLIFQVTYSPVTPTPTPTPTPPPAAPSINVNGKSVKRTTASSFVIRGKASSSTTSVQWEEGGKKQRADVRADGGWSIRITSLKPGKTIVRIRGIGTDGSSTAARTVTIVRR
ncbi:MAG: hypothetical protein ACREKL_07565 [Chthoniobacterales bacterium]